VRLEKESAEAKAAGKRAKDWFDRHELVMSFILGAGYSGADFFGGLLLRTA
jgi:hypothetical protein